jgi:hypothetical protein
MAHEMKSMGSQNVLPTKPEVTKDMIIAHLGPALLSKFAVGLELSRYFLQ